MFKKTENSSNLQSKPIENAAEWLSPCAVYTHLNFQTTAALQQILTKFGGYQKSLICIHVGVLTPHKLFPVVMPSGTICRLCYQLRYEKTQCDNSL